MVRFVLMRGHGKVCTREGHGQVCTHEGSWSGLYS